MTQASDSVSGSVTDFTYSGGLRIGAETTTGEDITSEVFQWDTLAGVPLLLADVGHEYVYGVGSAPVAQVDTATGVVEFLHGDLVGSTRAVTDSSGAVVGAWDYSMFGVVTTATGGASGDGVGVTRFLFAGEYLDDTGLYYLRARLYDPVTASFLSVDPALARTGSPYAYAPGNPLQLVDPLGLWPAGDPRDALGGILSTVKDWRSAGDLVIGVGCEVFTGFFDDAKYRAQTSLYGAEYVWDTVSNDWGNTAVFAMNHVNPVNFVATTGALAYGVASGGECDFSEENMMWVCTGADWHARGGTTLGATYITSKNSEKVDAAELGHEEIHSFQEATFGLPLFAGLYGLAEGTRSVIGALTPKEGDWGAGCNYWEQFAGLEEGGYNACEI